MQYQGKEGTLVVCVRFVFSDQIRQQSDRNHNCVLERKFVERPAKQDFAKTSLHENLRRPTSRLTFFNASIETRISRDITFMSFHFISLWHDFGREGIFPLCLTVNF